MRLVLSILLLSVCYSQDCEEGVVADDCGICGGNIFIIDSEYFQYVCEDTTTCDEVYECGYVNTTVSLGSDSYCSSASCTGYAYQPCSSNSQCLHSPTVGLYVSCDNGAYCVTSEIQSVYECGYNTVCETETQCGHVNTGICDCDGSLFDCNLVCGGDGIIDNCNTCDNDPLNDCVQDCADVWGGGATTDNCGVCDANSTNDNAPLTGTCDCAGMPNGTAVIDNCNTCDNDPLNDCVQDECGVWGGDGGISDHCGTCDNDPTNDCVQDECSVWGGDGILLWNECYSAASTEFLYLYESGLTGQIPESIGNLTNLHGIQLSNNQLTGQIPESIGNLTNLEYLYLYDNQLTGSIPNEIGDLSNLMYLGLSGNQLNGEIPPEIGNLTNLIALSLYDNQLTGSIPNEIGDLTELKSLVISNNMLTGELPEIIGELNNLYLLFVWGNELSGKIPESIGNLTQLERLSLSSNYFYGEIPESICDLSIEWGDTTESGGSNFQIFNNKLCIPYPDCIESYMGSQECYGCMDHNACNFNSNAVGNADNCTYSNQGFDCDGESLSLFNGLIPEDFSIHSIYPNPFNPITNISYGLPEYTNVQIIVYNLSGKQVETLISEFKTPGYHSVNWNADNLPSGVYLIRMDSGDFTQTQKVVLVK